MAFYVCIFHTLGVIVKNVTAPNLVNFISEAKQAKRVIGES